MSRKRRLRRRKKFAFLADFLPQLMHTTCLNQSFPIPFLSNSVVINSFIFLSDGERDRNNPKGVDRSGVSHRLQSWPIRNYGLPRDAIEKYLKTTLATPTITFEKLRHHNWRPTCRRILQCTNIAISFDQKLVSEFCNRWRSQFCFIQRSNYH